MSGRYFSEIRPEDRFATKELLALLEREGIRRDANIDYTVGLYEDDRLLATGSCWANTLRCLAVDGEYRGEGLLNSVVSHLIDCQFRRGNTHIFLYTKPDSTVFFKDLGFYEITRTSDAVFMENRRDGFAAFLKSLTEYKNNGSTAALVMNCNPFTLGHLALIERAARENDNAHIFVVSEDASFFPFRDRYDLVAKGTTHLSNVTLHETSSYMISQAVFPSYFLKDDESAIRAQASLDVDLFVKIAGALGATKRYVGDEPFSQVTAIYNDTMSERLPKAGVGCVIVPRFEKNGNPVSASRVRQLLHDDKIDEARELVPTSTYEYFFTDAGKRAIELIKKSDCVAHY